MSTGTELMETGTGTELIETGTGTGKTSMAGFKERLALGENVGGFTVKECFNTSGGEAELYFCEKEGARYVCKYFYDGEKDNEIPEKLKKLRHPSIMSLIDYGMHKGYFYTILEYAEGGVISDKTDGALKFLPLSEEKTIEAVSEIIEGFKTVHSKGIIHRDIKPDNLFYRKAENSGGKWIGSGVMLGDFGIASLFQADEGMTSHYNEHDFATEGYEAPEMYAVGKDSDSGNLTRRISTAIDYYALGVTVWVMLTGKEPFVDENGKPLSAGAIRRNAVNQQTANILISRAPEISKNMEKLIRGLLVKRHKERWDYQKIRDHFDGKEVEVFQEDFTDMPLEFAGEKCYSYIDISRNLIAHPKEGKQLIFGGKLIEYMWTLVGANIKKAQEIANELEKIIEDYSSKGREDEGLYAVAHFLEPSLPYAIGQNAKVKTIEDVLKLLETEPDLLVPVLRNPAKGFYAYFNVKSRAEKVQEIIKKVQKVADNTKSDLKLVPRLQIALCNDAITPFNDKINDSIKLEKIEQLEDLPSYLKERLIIFIEMKKDDITAWIEHLTGKDMDIWLDKYRNQKEWVKAWGAWRAFRIFLFRPERFVVKKNGKWGVVNGSGEEEVLPFSYEQVSVFDEERGLYQCKIDETWFIVDEKRKTLHEGKEPLQTITATGNPFDIICDSVHYYNSQFKALNKEGVKFEIAKAEDKNFIWLAADGGCDVYNGNGELQTKLQCSAFRVAFGAVHVQKNGKWGLVSPDGSKEIIPCNYADVKSGGIYCVLFKDGKEEGILRKQSKELYLLKFEKSGGVEILPLGGGNAIAKFESVAHLGLDYSDTEDFAIDGKMACLGYGELLWFDVTSGKTSKRNTISNGEAKIILAKMRAAEVYVLLQFLKEQGSNASMNQIISAAAELNPQSKTTWAATEGKTLWLNMLKLIDPSNAEGLSHSYDVFLSWMGIEMLKSGNNEEAYQYFSKAINLNANVAAYHAGGGAALFHQREYDKSAEFFNRAAANSKIKPITAQYLAAKGSAFFSNGKYNEAMAAFTMSIEELGNQATAEFYCARAACYQKLNMGDKARADIAAAIRPPQSSGEAIRRVPLPSPDASSVNIEQVSKSGNAKTVLNALDTLKSEGSVAAMNALIDASWQPFYEKKDYASAVAILKKLNPQTATGLKYPVSWYINLTGICLYSAKSYSEALPYFEDACKQAPKEGKYFYDSGNAYYVLKNWEKAAERYKEAAALGYAKANDELGKMKKEGKV
jgi:serine/threonine protein kinase/tetratricopeptide (TPR) repeat protein